MSVLPGCLSMHHLCARCSWRPEEGVRSPRSGVTNGCEAPCGCRELNSCLLEGQPELLTAELLTAEPSLQLQHSPFFSEIRSPHLLGVVGLTFNPRRPGQVDLCEFQVNKPTRSQRFLILWNRYHCMHAHTSMMLCQRAMPLAFYILKQFALRRYSGIRDVYLLVVCT